MQLHDSQKPWRKKAAYVVAEPEGFIVENKEGPLKEGELERATKWASQLSLAKKVPAPTAS